MQIKFSFRGIKEFKDLLKSLSHGLKIVVTRAFAEYLVGDENHGLKHEPARFNHGPDNPYKWQSEKQRRAFFATKGFGAGIPTVRTHDTVNSWTITETDSNWTMVKIENASKGAPWVFGEEQQRGHKADGWRKTADIVATNIDGAVRHAIAALNDWMKSKGFS